MNEWVENRIIYRNITYAKMEHKVFYLGMC